MTDYSQFDTNIKPVWFRICYVYIVLGLIIFNLVCFLVGCDVATAAEGWASYYTVESCQREGTSGVYTANGEWYDERGMTCALRRRDWGKSYLVCGPVGCAEVRHNDFGPGRGPTAKGVIVDLTPRAFKAVCGDLRQGRCEVGVMPVVE